MSTIHVPGWGTLHCWDTRKAGGCPPGRKRQMYLHNKNPGGGEDEDQIFHGRLASSVHEYRSNNSLLGCSPRERG